MLIKRILYVHQFSTNHELYHDLIYVNMHAHDNSKKVSLLFRYLGMGLTLRVILSRTYRCM